MNSTDLSYLFLPPVSIVAPPVDTLINTLPLDKLSWHDFERLCLAIVERDFSIDDCQIFGLPGQSQFGIDIYARKPSGKYSTYQCKQYSTFKSADLQKAVNKFGTGFWEKESEDFFLCTSCDLSNNKIQIKFESLKKELKIKGVDFFIWDSTYLNRILIDYPLIVYRFFGSHWVQYFNGKDALFNLSREFQLDNANIQLFRNDLNTFYSTVFNTYDPGLFTQEIDAKSFLLQDRFIIPDVIVSIRVDLVADLNAKDAETIIEQRNEETYDKLPDRNFKSDQRKSFSIDHHSHRTIQSVSGIDIILPQHKRCVILGEPGSGKSTLLRCIILDLLNPNPKLSNVVKFWGGSLPVWIPFAFLTKNLFVNPNLSIQEILKLWFKSHNTEILYRLVEFALKDKRLILFVDGLDEWSNISAAHQALTKIEILSELLDTRIIYSSRPHGFKYLQDSIRKVEVLSLAPFTYKKQQEFITRWLSYWYSQTNQKREFHDNLNAYIKHQSDTFHKEISSSQDLRSLAEYPLLLNILIFQKLRDLALSKNKTNAFEEMVSYLIEKHPAKRKVQANIIDDTPFELSDNLRDIFTELALDTLLNNSDGIILKSDAQKLFEKYLVSTYGFDKGKSRMLSKQLLEIGANSIGIIIEKSSKEISFVHRQFLEFLAAKCLAGSDKEKTDKVLQHCCLNPIWHQTIISFFNLIPQGKRQDFLYNFSILKSVETNFYNKHYSNCLQYEVSITLQNSPIDLTKENFYNLLKTFNFETNISYKKKYLEILMDGISNPKLSSQILGFSKSYLPNYTPYFYFSMPSLRSLKTNLITPEIIHFIKLSFLNGTSELRLETSEVIRSHILNSELRDFSLNILYNEFDFNLRAYSLNSIISNDFPEVKLKIIIDEHRFIRNPLIQLFCIKGKILLNIHDESDLDTLIDIDTLSFRLDEMLLQMLLDGWGKSEKLRNICLKTVERNIPRSNNLRNTTAWKILFHSFNDDKTVIDKIIKEIKTEEHPFNIFHEYNGWPQIAYYFKKQPELANCIDYRINENFSSEKDYIPEPEFAYMCLASRSDFVKRRLIELLPVCYFSHWIVMALIEGWEDDIEVNCELKKYFRSENKSKSYAAHFIAKVFKNDKDERIRLMEEILFDQTFYFRERVLNAFLELDKDYFETNILQRFLTVEIYSFSLSDDFNPFQNCINILAQEFYDSKLVQKFIFRTLKESFYYFDLIVKKEPLNSSRLNSMLQTSLPLSTELTSIMLDKLESKISSNKEILNIFFQFPEEGNIDVSFSMAIRLFKYLKFTNPRQILELSQRYIFYRGSNYEIHRQIAFSGYLILEELSEYFQLKEDSSGLLASPQLSFYESYEKLNIDLIRLLIEKFEYLYTEIKGDFKKISKHSSEKGELPWSFFAKYSDSSAPSCSYIINYITENINNLESLDLLEFLNRVNPKSNLLKKFAIRLVQNSQNDHIQISAGNILGSNFANDESIKNIMLDGADPLTKPGKLTALCVGWPFCPELMMIFNDCKKQNIQITNSSGYYLKFLFRDANHIFNFILDIITSIDLTSNHPFYYIPLMRRIAMDEHLQSLLVNHLLITEDISQKISLYSIMKKVSGINETISNWRTLDIAKTEIHDFGYNLVTNSTVSLKAVLLSE